MLKCYRNTHHERHAAHDKRCAKKNSSATYVKCGSKRQPFKSTGMNADNDLGSVGDAKRRGYPQESGKRISALVNSNVAMLATREFEWSI